MKKLLVLLILTFSNLTFGQQTVPSIWSFNIANIQGSYYRALLDESNRIQKKYNFIVENKPGAGGAVGASAVLNSDRITLLGTAAAFFVRPYLYTSNPYQFEDFKPVHVMTVSPAALVTKNKSLADLVGQNSISIGHAGLGSMTHLMALKFQEYYPNKDIKLVPYKSSTEALQDVLGGHIDATYEYISDAESKNAKIIATTGDTKIKEYPLLKDIGYRNQEHLVGIYIILVKKDTPDSVVNELRSIFAEADKSTRVQELYRSDYGTKPKNLKTASEYSTWYKNTIDNFKELTKGVKAD